MKILLIDNCNECPFRKTIRGDFHCKKAERFLFKDEMGQINLPWWCPLDDAPDAAGKEKPPKNRRSDKQNPSV